MPDNTQTSEFILVEQAMGNPPSWLVYWGITIVAIFFAVVLGISAMVSYPDVLQAQATTYIDRPPTDVFSKINGTIHTLLVQDDDTIQYNSPLLLLESTTDWNAILDLDTFLQQDRLPLSRLGLSAKELGQLNTLYQELVLLEIKIKDATKSDITSKRVSNIHKEIAQNKLLNASLLKQKKVFEKELRNIKKDLERSQQLLEEGVLSQQDFEKKENTYLQNERALHQIESSVISNTINIQKLSLQIPESEKQQHDLFFRLETESAQKKEALKTAIKEWKEQYIVCSPSIGTISLANQLQNGNKVTSAEALATIMPLTKGKKSFLKAKMDAQGIGKITIGQKATVYFNNYPSSEYGTLTATVFKMAPIPTEDQYEVILELPEDWITNYGISIPKQQKMGATVAVQTKEYTLLVRIFSGLLDVLKN